MTDLTVWCVSMFLSVIYGRDGLQSVCPLYIKHAILIVFHNLSLNMFQCHRGKLFLQPIFFAM